VLFTGIVPTDKGVHFSDEPYVGLGLGVFRADKNGHISSVVVPGDAAPGGGVFDATGEYGSGPWVTERGDIGCVGPVAGQEAGVTGFPPQAAFISQLGRLYLRYVE